MCANANELYSDNCRKEEQMSPKTNLITDGQILIRVQLKEIGRHKILSFCADLF